VATEPQPIPAVRPDLPANTSAILGVFGKNTLWIWVDRGLLSIGTLLAGLLLVRYLGPADFGHYSVALSAGVLVAVVMDLGFTRYAARVVAASPREGRSIMSLGLLTSVVLLLGEMVALVVAALLKNGYLAVICAGLILGNFGRLHDLTGAFLRAELRSRAMVLGSTISRLGHIVVIFIVIGFRLSVLDLLLGYSLVAVPALALRLRQLWHHGPALRELSWRGFWSVSRHAWPFFSFSLSELGYSQVFVLTFSIVASRHEVGLLSAGLVIISLLHQWASATADAVLPLMTRLYEAGRIRELLELRSRILEALLILSIPVVVVLFVFAPQICALLGGKYAASAPVLRILALRAPLWILEGFLGAGFLNATNRVAGRRNAFAFALVVLVILTLILGRIWGPQGAAVAFWIATFCILWAYIRLCSSIGGELRLTSAFAATGSAALVMAALCLKLSNSMFWVLAIPPALLIYFAVLFFFARTRLLSAGRTLRECLVG